MPMDIYMACDVCFINDSAMNIYKLLELEVGWEGYKARASFNSTHSANPFPGVLTVHALAHT